MNLSLKKIQEVIARKGYQWFDDQKPYLPNIIGIRTNDNRSNLFNDFIILCYLDLNKSWQLLTFKATTDPGVYWRKNPMNVSGTAILKPGQYLDCWKIGKHQGKYEALVQMGAKTPMTVWRDNNKDDVLDFNCKKEETGFFGINLHRTNKELVSVQVDKWSAGCQVTASSFSLTKIVDICKCSAKLRLENSFSYTLLEENDFN